ncbi:MAG: hypothetical protein K0S76_3214, partial [Herbinix sp.]|nr:hypothetical protein [Herbinix sp.]
FLIVSKVSILDIVSYLGVIYAKGIK